ncbi:MAG: hypothetical protein ACKODX_02855 [Gemmata sp.]
MFLRQLRWAVAGLAVVAAVCASPARSKADVQILVEEYAGPGGTGALVGSSTFFVGAPTAGNFFAQPFSFTAPGGYYSVSSGSTLTNSGLGTTEASLSTSFNVGITSAYNSTAPHSLRITVTDDNFTSDGLSQNLTNGVSVPLLPSNALSTVSSFSRIYNPTSGVTAANSGLLAGYLTSNPSVAAPNLGITDPAVLTNASQTSTSTLVAGLPSPYAVQQEIVVTVSGPQSLIGKTFTVNASAETVSNPVPAPGGLMLALAALPVLGLRRTLRKRAAV